MKHGKKYRSAAAKVDRSRQYPLDEAIALAKETSPAKFDATVEFTVNLGVDPRHADQQVRGTVSLPHGTGKVVRVAVFADGEHVKAAQDAGADFVGLEDLIQKITVQRQWMAGASPGRTTRQTSRAEPWNADPGAKPRWRRGARLAHRGTPQ